ncbi:outer membrane protein assembly factor BamB [Halotalea alkalilenta]|uniref:outer membrane protein assembly factor BamB n=1 Tax=Halotalea alkalilenta TaxID=376489 RepID=UPI0004807D20|nr:outer membrane protein assembly factor BamB [Halotalea alkalilenta]
MNSRTPMRSLMCALGITMLLAGCGGGVKPDPPPKELGDIQPQVRLDQQWSRGIGDLGRARYPLEPALDAGVLYTVNAEGRLRAINAESGEVSWESELHVPVSTGVSVSAGRLFIGTRKGEVLAVSLGDGNIVWRTQVASEVLTTPQANNSLIVVQSVDGTLTALDKLTGDQRWLYAASQPTLTLRGTGTPRTIDPVTFAGFANGRVGLFDNRSGEMMWDMRISVPQGANEVQQLTDVIGQPVLTPDGRLFVTSYNGQVVAVNVQNGQTLWSREQSSYRSPLLVGNTLFTVDERSHVHALDANSGEPLWEQDGLEGRQLTAPVFVDGQIALGDYEGYVHLLNAGSGEMDGRARIGGDGIGVPLLSDGNRLYALSNSGKLVAFQLIAQ